MKLPGISGREPSEQSLAENNRPGNAREHIWAAMYFTVKDPVCDVIISAAEGWARATGWQPGPSDT